MAFNGWKRKCQLTISSSSADSDLSDFPWLFTEDNLPSEMFDADGSFPALDGGGDIRFSSDADGNTRLSIEVVNFEIDNDPANGKAEIWVKLPTLSSASGATVYVWYGKTGESQPARDATYGSEDVWSDDYRAVFHFNQDLSVDDLNDSSPYENHGTPFNYSSSDLIDGLYGKALNTDGASEGIIIPDATSLEPDSVSLQATLNLPIAQTSSSYPKIVHKGDDSSSPYGAYGLQHQNSATSIAMIIGRGDGQRYSIASGLSTGTWMQVYGYSAEYARYTGIVINESIYDQDDHGSGTFYYDSSGAGVANSGNSQSFWEGNLEELRIGGSTRTFDENESFYRTQFGIGTYTTVGTPESNDLYITPSSITSGENFGSPTITTGNVTLTTFAITSGEQFGTPTVNVGNVNIAPSSITSEENFGSPVVFTQNTIEPTGIPTAEAWGTPVVLPTNTILVASIPPAEAWGTPTVSTSMSFVTPSGIASEEHFGTPTVSTGNLILVPSSILTGEAWGTPTLHLTIYADSILTGEHFGTPSLSTGNTDVLATSILSSEQFGTPDISVGNVNVEPSGIASGEVWGDATITTGNIDVAPSSITSSEAWGTPDIALGSTGVLPAGIVSGEQFGNPVISTGNVNVAPSGISSQEAFGTPIIVTGNTFIVDAGAIASEEQFGSPTVTTGNVDVAPNSIQSLEIFGNPSVTVGAVEISPSGIATSEQFGNPNIIMHLHPESILSGENFGEPTLSTGNVSILPGSIVSEEVFGEPIIRNLWVLAPEGISSAEAWGTPTVTAIVLNTFETMMEADLEEVFFNTEEFAITCTYIHKSGTTITNLAIIFDDEYIEVDPGTGAPIMSTDPQIMCQTSDFSEHHAKGDKLLIRGERFQVVTFEPDGTGVTKLKLHKERTI